MTIKEIADVSNVDKTTVQRWIAKVNDAKRIEIDAKCIEAEKTKKPADFSLSQTIAIVRAGGNETLADLLFKNAIEELKPKLPKIDKIPNGNQLRELRKIFTNEEMKEFILKIVGFQLTPRDYAAKVGEFVEGKIRAAQQARIEADQKQGKLGL